HNLEGSTKSMISDRAAPLCQTGARSLSDRLSALSVSADRWKTRVEKKSDLDKCCPGNRSTNRAMIGAVRTPRLPIDDGLNSFFKSKESNENTSPETIDLDDLDAIQPTQKLSAIRKTPVARPKKSRVSRPRESKDINELADVNFVKPSLEGVKEDVLVFAVSEDLNEPVTKSARNGLSAVEDYSQTKKSLRSPSINHSSYPEVMLVQVGGDGFIDVRCVIVSKESVHDAACYLLISHTSLIIHNGNESKVLERSKAMQIASSVLHTKQLNCKAAKVERTCDSDTVKRQFWRKLESTSEKSSVLTGNDLVKKNRIFAVDNNLDIGLQITSEVPCYSILDTSKCLIFDFHSELYIWSGRDCLRSQTLAAEDYSKQMQSQLSSFLIFRKISQGLPDVLFSSKFVNWPTASLSTSRPQLKTPVQRKSIYKWKESIQSDATSIANHLLRSEENKDEIILEDVPLDGTNENVITERMKFWILEKDHLSSIENTNEFNRDSCYVVKWQYRIETRVGRLKNRRDTEEERETGRERIAFFYWLGRKSGVKEQGACALRLSEMEKAKSPHIRMEEGAEPSIFLSLFNGLFTVRDNDMDGNTNIFLVLSKSHKRSSFSQMDLSCPLRSHGTYAREKGKKWVVVAGVDSDIKDVRSAFNKWDGDSSEMECIVQGDDASIEWIECKEGSMKPRMYRILGSESSIVQPCRPGTAFPYSQNCLDGSILVDCGKIGWLWTADPLSDTTLNVALIMANERKFPVQVIEKGGEQSTFKAIFPSWEEYEEKKEEKTRKLESIIEERLSLTPEQVIKRRNELNEQIDVENIEKNLSEELFQELYGMSRSEFMSLPQWKKLLVRKEKGYF
ncbi:hypothetical protein PMAYCL1PPCAC_30985, partial [Pristionchus mayeri]